MTVKITPEVGEKILQLSARGVFQAAIGREVGLSQTAVSRYLRKNGITKSRPPVPGGQRWCRTCQEAKPVSEFWKYAANSEGLCTSCKTCMGDRHKARRNAMRHRVKKVYGMTLEAYDELRAASPCCPICGSDSELHLDHDEESGRVREFLCGKCNRGIGMFDHNIDFLEAAIKYLKRHE